MDLLDEGSANARNTNQKIAEIVHIAAAPTRQADRYETSFARRLQGSEDVLGSTGRRNAKKYIASSSESLHLAREDLLIPIIVADGGQNGAVCRQGEGRERRAIEVEPPHEFAGDMLGIGRATAVSRNQDLVTGTQRFNHALRGISDNCNQPFVGQRIGQQVAGTLQVLDNASAVVATQDAMSSEVKLTLSGYPAVTPSARATLGTRPDNEYHEPPPGAREINCRDLRRIRQHLSSIGDRRAISSGSSHIRP